MEVICPNCGERNDGSRFCINCGSPISDMTSDFTGNSAYTRQSVPYSEGDTGVKKFAEPGSGLGVISLVVAIAGFTCFGPIGGIIAIILGKRAQNYEKEKALGRIAVFIGIADIAYFIIGIVISLLLRNH